MGSSIWISQSQRTFQLRLIFGLFFLLSLAYAALTVGIELQLILFGSTARASVVYVSAPYDAHGRQVATPRVDYEYYDAAAHVNRRDICWVKTSEPTPTVGQSLDVQYIPGKGFSQPITGESRASQFWPIIPVLVLGSLLALSYYNQNAKAR